MAVTDRALCGGAEGLVAAVEAAISGGANVVQLREKDLPPAGLLGLARRPRRGPGGGARAAGAAGAPLRGGAPLGSRSRHGFLVGCSIHSLEAARRAEAEG